MIFSLLVWMVLELRVTRSGAIAQVLLHWVLGFVPNNGQCQFNGGSTEEEKKKKKKATALMFPNTFW